MSQPPTLFPKSQLGSTPGSGSATPAGATPSASPQSSATSPVRQATPAPASPFKPASAVPPTLTQQPSSGLTGGVSRPATATTPPPGLTPGLGQTARPSAFGAQPAPKPGLGTQSTLGQPSPRPLAGSTVPPRPAGASPASSLGTPAAPRPPLTPSAAFRTADQASAAVRSTSPFRKDLQISDEEFLQLRDFIYQQCGIFIAENRKYLVENRLSNRIKELNLKSYSEYYNFLRFDASRRTELSRLFEVVTTNETSFFRNPPQLEVFQKSVLPGILDQCRKSGRKKLRIWSAGCSTGEEPYTLAIILCEVLKGELSSWDIKITANDLSEAVLASARRGVYSDYALRTTPKEIVDAYFIKEDGQYKIKPELKALISFGPINLNDKDQLRRVEKSQIVFCRNVIIYFDDDMKRRVINAFYDNLEINGALLIGHSESLHNISRAFQLEHHKGTIVYRKMS